MTGLTEIVAESQAALADLQDRKGARWRMEWRVASLRDLKRWGGVPQSSRERSFALAAVRSMNSGQPQRVRHVPTGEEWRVSVGPDSWECRRLRGPGMGEGASSP